MPRNGDYVINLASTYYVITKVGASSSNNSSIMLLDRGVAPGTHTATTNDNFPLVSEKDLNHLSYIIEKQGIHPTYRYKERKIKEFVKQLLIWYLERDNSK